VSQSLRFAGAIPDGRGAGWTLESSFTEFAKDAKLPNVEHKFSLSRDWELLSLPQSAEDRAERDQMPWSLLGAKLQ
jgi:hypothetical protein